MSQFKVYGPRPVLASLRARLSHVLHAAAVDVLGLPEDQAVPSLLSLGRRGLPRPAGRSERYTVIEVLMFEGRSVATKKSFYARLYADAAAQLGINATDLEISIVETPRHDWGIRGQAGDELALTYEVQR